MNHTKKAKDIGIYTEFVSIWEIKFLLCYLIEGKCQIPSCSVLKKMETWEEPETSASGFGLSRKEDFWFKLPAAYVRLTPLLCL